MSIGVVKSSFPVYRSAQPEEYLPIELTSRWLICLWDMIAVSQPVKILVASAPVESITFDCLYPDLLYAGLSDGYVFCVTYVLQ